MHVGQAGLLNRGETEMRGPTVVKKICVESWQALTHVRAGLAGLGVCDTVWTHAVKSELCAAGQALGYYVCTSGVTQAKQGEWLFDQVWMNGTPPRDNWNVLVLWSNVNGAGPPPIFLTISRSSLVRGRMSG